MPGVEGALGDGGKDSLEAIEFRRLLARLKSLESVAGIIHSIRDLPNNGGENAVMKVYEFGLAGGKEGS